ncbi:hypothetical protein Ga0061079_1255 [Apibacter mensalis]|uniref:Immunity protein 17 n=1 Tax=Apibacter mensalis TaxID=1586267 RepID=A0A0X3ASA8_9FLAO|nr:hypothetical protein [Apibacter mensalis]CVK17224.1 hypothetical protein Ga0061079_1255 [Apibacter mensalis]
MEDWIQQHQAGICGAGLLILGVETLFYMIKYGDKKEDRVNESAMSKSNRLGLYFMSGVGIVGGIFILLRELFS